MLQQKRLFLILLSIASALLLGLGWTPNGFAPLLFFAFIPLLLIEEELFRNAFHYGKFRIFSYAFISFFFWNLMATWWIWNSTAVGAILAVLLNSLFMAFAFSLFHWTRSVFRNKGNITYLSLIVYWISFEYIHHIWEINWPWLTLGNGFASDITWIQWYEYTGAFGGSLWILVLNIFLFLGLRPLFFKDKASIKYAMLLISMMLFFLPVIISKYIFKNYEEKENPVDIALIQPNLDPYSEQYELSPEEVVSRIASLTDSIADSSVQYIVCPESALQEDNMFESYLHQSRSYRLLRDLLKKYPNAKIVIGASTFKLFKDADELSPTARKFKDADKYYDAYNAALMIDNKGGILKYHKSKLTPGVEIMPYARYLGFLEDLALDLGGTVGSLGTDARRTVFEDKENNLSIAPVICYESVFGEFVTGYMRNGAELIFVITNDGWWGHTKGHIQHLLFSSVRAIENRRSVARSANTGISCFINQRGEIQQPTPYWLKTAIRQQINANDEITFYSKYGDYIARLSVFVAVLYLLMTISKRLRAKSPIS